MNVTLKRLRPVYSVFNPTWMDLSNEKLVGVSDRPVDFPSRLLLRWRIELAVTSPHWQLIQP